MGLLGVAHLRRVLHGLGGQVLVAVQGRDRLAGVGEGRLRKREAVRAHVRDEAHALATDFHAFVQGLGDAHGAIGAEAQLAVRLLLKGGGHEGGMRLLAALFGLEFRHGPGALVPRSVRQPLRSGFVQQQRLGVLLLAGVRVEVLAVRHALGVHELQFGRKRAVLGLKLGLDVPVAGAHERAALAFPLDDQFDRGALYAARAEGASDLGPQHGRQHVAVKPVEDAARLLGLDERLIEVSRVPHRLQDRLLGDLVERDALDLHAFGGLKNLQEVPRDALALPIFVRGEHEGVLALHGRLQFLNLRLLPSRHLVDGGEIVVDIDGKVRPPHLAELFWQCLAVLGQVPNVADTGRNFVVRAEVRGDGLGFGGGFDDNEFCGHVGTGDWGGREVLLFGGRFHRVATHPTDAS